jgi:hypothetical protein
VPVDGAVPAPGVRDAAERRGAANVSKPFLAISGDGETVAQLVAGYRVSTTTAWRYVNESVMLLPARSPKLGRALAKADKDGLGYLVLDGTLIPIDRVRADQPFYSGKHKDTP